MWDFFKSFIKRIIIWLTSVDLPLLIGTIFFKIRQRKNKEINLAHIKSVLVIKLDQIGDMICITPFLRELRHSVPHAWITLIVKRSTYDLVEYCPYCNEILMYDCSINDIIIKSLKGSGLLWNFLHLYWMRSFWRALLFANKYLRKRNFDLAIVPRWGEDSYHASFISYFSSASVRIAYSEHVRDIKKSINYGFDRLMTHVLRNDGPRHLVELTLDMVRYIEGEVHNTHLEIWLKKEDEVFADDILKKNQLNCENLLVSIAPGASELKRRWPVSNFIELGKWIVHEYNASILIIGGPGEEIVGQQLQVNLNNNSVNLVGTLSICQSAAMIKRTSLFIGNDSGLMHIAAALGVPVLGISCHPKRGSTASTHSPLYCAPWGNGLFIQPAIPREPCVEECGAKEPHCISHVTIDETKDAVRHFLERQEISKKAL